MSCRALPPKSLTGGEGELVDAIMRIDNRDAGAVRGLVRQGLADRYAATAGWLVGGENHYGGARFAKDVAGTPTGQAAATVPKIAIARPPSIPRSDDRFRAPKTTDRMTTSAGPEAAAFWRRPPVTSPLL